MKILLSPSKQKNNASLTCIPIPPLVTRERDFSPDSVDTWMQRLPALLNTNISSFVNLTSTGSHILMS